MRSCLHLIHRAAIHSAGVSPSVRRLSVASSVGRYHLGRRALKAVSIEWKASVTVCSVNGKSVDRIIYSIFQKLNLEWKTRTLGVFEEA